MFLYHGHVKGFINEKKIIKEKIRRSLNKVISVVSVPSSFSLVKPSKNDYTNKALRPRLFAGLDKESPD